MNLTVDPDVFTAAFLELPCLNALNKIAAEVSVHRFLRDTEGVLQNEYRRIFNEQFRDESAEHPAIRLLQQILVDDGNPEDELSSSHDLVETFRELGCTEPVEPVLLGMMANARHTGLSLMLVGKNTQDARRRNLHDDNIRWTIRRQIPWLDIIPAGSTKIELVRMDLSDDNPPHIKAKADAFESKAALFLQDQDPLLRCITPPHKGKIGGEQIDLFGYRDARESSTVVVGECKLRRQGNEGKLIECKELQQLRRKVIAAQNYEMNSNRRERRPPEGLLFEGILISNANSLDEEAERFVLSEQSFTIRIMHVTLSTDWETHEQWGIVEGKWLAIDSSVGSFTNP